MKQSEDNAEPKLNIDSSKPADVIRLLTLIWQFEKSKSLLGRALEACDRHHVTHYDQFAIQTFDQILEFHVEGPEARVLLVEFLLDYLQIGQSTVTDRIRSKVLDIVRSV